MGSQKTIFGRNQKNVCPGIRIRQWLLLPQTYSSFILKIQAKMVQKEAIVSWRWVQLTILARMQCYYVELEELKTIQVSFGDLRLFSAHFCLFCFGSHLCSENPFTRWDFFRISLWFSHHQCLIEKATRNWLKTPKKTKRPRFSGELTFLTKERLSSSTQTTKTLLTISLKRYFSSKETPFSLVLSRRTLTIKLGWFWGIQFWKSSKTLGRKLRNSQFIIPTDSRNNHHHCFFDLIAFLLGKMGLLD